MFEWTIHKVRLILFGNKCSRCMYDDICTFSDDYKRAQTYGAIKCCGYQRKK